MYEIEVVRKYGDEFNIESIEEKTNGRFKTEREALKFAKGIKLRSGKTFFEEIHLLKIDKNGDIIENEYIRSSDLRWIGAE